MIQRAENNFSLVDYSKLGSRTKYNRYSLTAPILGEEIKLKDMSTGPLKGEEIINPDFRISKYSVGMSFGLHSDSLVRRGDYVSVYTVLVSLNDDYEGGETLLNDKINIQDKIIESEVKTTLSLADMTSRIALTERVKDKGN